MKRKTCLNNGWQFLEKEYSEENLQCPDGEYMPVRLPHDYLIYDVRNLYRDSVGWYRRKLMYVPDGLERVLFFEGIYMDSEVFINGRSAGTWKYGYSSFEVDITPYLEAGENELLVRVVHRSPNSRWYSGAGIYRSVYLIERERTHIASSGLYITPVKREASDTWDVEVEVEAAQGADDEKPFDSIRYIITQKNGKHDMRSNEEDSLCIIFNQLIGEKSNIYRHTFEITAPKLWDIYCGNLYELRAELIKAGEVFDYEQSVFGFRTIEIDSDKGFLLNGRHVKIKGSCEHHGFGCLGAAVNKSAVRRKLEGLKRMGVNAVRTAHNMPSVEFMELADEMGFLVDSEAFDMWGHTKTKYDYGRFFAESAKKDVESWIRRDRNHPSIIMWSVGNEIYDMHAGDEGLAELVMLLGEVKKHDPKKHAFTTFASNYMRWENTQKCAGLVDAVGYNYGEYLYEEHHAKHPDWVIYGSETSSMLASRGVYHFPIETSTVCDTDEQCSALGNCSAGWGAHSYTDNIIADRDAGFSLGQFIWAGVDYFGEPTPYHTRNSYFGQMDTARFEKDSYYIYQAEWTSFKENPMVHVFPHWDFNPGQLVDVCVCSNAPIVELFVNGMSMGRKVIDHAHGTELVPHWKVPYEKGYVEAVAYDEGGKELARQMRHSFSDADRLVIEADRQQMGNQYGELIFVEIGALDKDGYTVDNANNRVEIKVTGAGRLVGLDNGDSTDFDQVKTSSRRLFGGKLLAVIAPVEGVTGKITVTAEAEGLWAASIDLCVTDDKNMRDEYLVQSCICTDKNNMSENSFQLSEDAEKRNHTRNADGLMDSVYSENEGMESSIKKTDISVDENDASMDKKGISADKKGSSIEKTDRVIGTADTLASEIPIRKVELTAETFTLSADKSSVKVHWKLYPENATYRDLKWSITDTTGIAIKSATVIQQGEADEAMIKTGTGKAPDKMEAAEAQVKMEAVDMLSEGYVTVNAAGDGSFYLRCDAYNGRTAAGVRSSLEFTAAGIGPAYLDPYEPVSAGLCLERPHGLSEGVGHGVRFLGKEKTKISFGAMDFGVNGSEQLQMYLFKYYPGAVKLRIYLDDDSKNILDAEFDESAGWLEFKKAEYRLSERIKGIHHISIESEDNFQLNSFSFVPVLHGFDRINAADYDEIFGDSYKVDGTAVTGIGNNVSIIYRRLNMGAQSADKIKICGRTANAKDSIRLKIDCAGTERTELIEFEESAAPVEREFNIAPVGGEITVTLLYLPGCNFDLEWFRFLQE